MNIDNTLLLGLVFITAGVALALLAYAVLLNRRSSNDEEESEQPAASETESWRPSQPTEAAEIPSDAERAIPGFEEPTRLIQTSPPPATSEPTVEPGPSEQDLPPATVGADTSEPKPAEMPPIALIRSPVTGKLIIRVGQDAFGSMSELKKSEAWEQIGGLFEELHTWMAVVPPQTPSQPKVPPAEPAAPTKKAGGQLSMVEQIDEILQEKLAASDTAPQGVYMAEGAAGSIRVFIGVESYEMDQVPNEEVRRLIREAVSEWESRA
jgi:hypothetical protein